MASDLPILIPPKKADTADSAIPILSVHLYYFGVDDKNRREIWHEIQTG